MAKTTPYHSDGDALERLERQLQEESQRIKDACIQVTQIDPDAEPIRFDALVCAMLDALDRQVALDNSAAPDSPTIAQQADLFGGIGVEPGALNALIAQLRSQSSGDEQSSDRFLVLSNYVDANLAQGGEDAPFRSIETSIDWESLAVRMDALRERLARETVEDRAGARRQQSAGGATASWAAAPAPGGDNR